VAGLAIGALLVLAACGGGDDGGSATSGGPSGEESGAGRSRGTGPEADAGDGSSGDQGSGGGEENFDEEVRAVAELVERFWADVFAAEGLAYEPVGAFGSYRAGDGTTCGGQLLVPDNALYCPPEDFIAFDERWLREFYEKTGDGVVYVIIPHEWGHAVQARLGSGFALGIEQELQADCYAGAFVAHALASGAVEEEAGDADEMFGNLAAVADPTDEWWRPDAHGTTAQRQGAFAEGVRGGVGAC
jgi:predicted metalloprotease